MKDPQPASEEQRRTETVKLYAEGWGVEALSKQLACSYDTAKRYLLDAGVTLRKYKRLPLTPDMEMAMVKAYQEGGTLMSIAATYQCSTAPVTRILDKHGVSRREYHNRELHRTHFNRDRLLPASVYNNRMNGALRNRIAWEITIEDISSVYVVQRGLCFYTGLPLKTAGHDHDYREIVKNDPCALSIDRRDSNVGYTKDNIVLCCRFINYAKNAYPEDVFKQTLARAAASVCGELRGQAEDMLSCPT